MVRTLSSALSAALNAQTRVPALTLSVEDHVLHYAPYQTPSTPDAWNDACLANDNSLIRVQVTRGGSGLTSTFQFQRITDPSQASQWATSAWSVFSGSTGLMFQDAGCAVSNSAGTLRAFAQRGTGGNTLWVWTSVTNGLTWAGPVAVLAPPGSALIRGLSSAGNHDVFFLYDVSGGEALGCSFFSGSWSALTTWSFAPLLAGSGLAAAFAGSVYTLIYADGYSLNSCTFNPTTTTWSTGPIVAPATSAAIERTAPRLSFADGLYTLTCIETDTGVLTGVVYSYPRLRQSSDLVHWSNGLIFHDLASTYGAIALKIPIPTSGSAGTRYYVATLATVASAPAFQATNLNQALDLSAAVLSYQRVEQLGRPARCEVRIANAGGVYNALVTTGASYQPLGPNASLILSEGYLVGTPPVTPAPLKVGVYYLSQIQFVRSPQENELLLVGLDRSRDLDLLSRYQYNYTNQTLGWLITEVCARAGLFALNLPATSQISQSVPAFVLHADRAYRQALDELCSTYGLAYFLDQDEVLQFRELAAGDPSVWSYQPEIEQVSFGSSDQRANHIIVSGRPPAGGLPQALTMAEAYDDADLHLVGVERLLQHVDQKLITVAQCQQKANFLLLQEARAQRSHAVTLPLNPALQLLDVITLTDSVAPVGSGQSGQSRVRRLLCHYAAQEGLYETQLELEGV